MLALSNEPQQLVEAVLDKLLQVLNIDCCWVQLLSPESRDLKLVGCRGFTTDMIWEIGLSQPGHTLSDQAVMGHKITLPDLSRDREYRLSSFVKAGLHSLAAVPIRTYRPHGVIGIASRTKKRFRQEDAELLMAIAGMIGAALNTAELSQVARLSQGRPPLTGNPGAANPSHDDHHNEPPQAAPPGKPQEPPSLAAETFDKHARRMATFRASHRLTRPRAPEHPHLTGIRPAGKVVARDETQGIRYQKDP